MTNDVGDSDSDSESDSDLDDIQYVWGAGGRVVDVDQAIDSESPRAADDPNFGWLEADDGHIIIYDDRNPLAWISSTNTDELRKRR